MRRYSLPFFSDSASGRLHQRFISFFRSEPLVGMSASKVGKDEEERGATRKAEADQTRLSEAKEACRAGITLKGRARMGTRKTGSGSWSP